MRQFLPTLCVLALLAPVVAKAADPPFPARRAGLWVNTVKTAQGVFVRKACTSPETDLVLRQRGFDDLRKTGRLTVTGSGSKFHMTIVSVRSGHTVATNEDIVFAGDTDMQTRGHIHVAPPFARGGMATDSDVSGDEKWSGPCPPGMVPGDMIVGGRKFNPLKAPAR